MISTLALAEHEYRSAIRSKVLLALLITCVVVTSVSILIAAFTFKTKVADYNAYKAAAQAAGASHIAEPLLYPLQLLRGANEYLEIIGAVIAIALGYVSVARERSNNTLQLVLTRPVTTAQLVSGRLLGALLIFLSLVSVTGIVAVLAIGVISGTWLSSAELLKLVVTYGISIVYLLLFYCLGALVTLRSRNSTNGLIVGLAIWLLIVMILPQIGDTMDPDNQVPGGLFHALQVEKPQEKAILAHFKTYESIRNGIEVASIEKHYERFSFAVLGIKDEFNKQPLVNIVQAKRYELVWLGSTLVLLSGGLGLSMQRKYTTRKGDVS